LNTKSGIFAHVYFTIQNIFCEKGYGKKLYEMKSSENSPQESEIIFLWGYEKLSNAKNDF
jgi:hypothetical protein